jgi:hypothetical protein
VKDAACDNAEMLHEGTITAHAKIEEAKHERSKNHSTESRVQESAFRKEIKIT